MFISCGKTYRYKGVTFDWHDYLGPVILNRHTFNERNFRNVKRRQWALFGKWHRLSAEKREQHRVN